MTPTPPSLAARFVSEVLGTFILVFFGCGAVHAAVLTGAQSGLWQVAIVWGVAIMLAAYVCGGISGAHINPAMTIALAAWGGFPWRAVIPYIAAQLVGAMLAAGVLLATFNGFHTAKEREHRVNRGENGSEITAMCFGEYFPNPALVSTTELYKSGDYTKLAQLAPHPVAFALEVIGTMLLALVVFAVMDERNPAAPLSRLGPVFIGLAAAVLISVLGPLTQACLNPARDFGPRLVAYLGGWGKVAIPGPNGIGFATVYILAPILGALAGGGIYARLLAPVLSPAPAEKSLA